jgi:CRP-like cAMP-binding protein
MNSLATKTRCRRGQRVNSYPDREGHWYRVVSGAARQCVMQADGHRRIIAFLLPGDFFGPEVDCRRSVVEAAVDGTVIASCPRPAIERLAKSDPGIAEELRDLLLASVHRLQRQILLLGHGPALERVCSFLLGMVERSHDGQGDRVVLPMSRYDIADNLVLSVETVSRCLTALQRRNAIMLVGSRELKILSRRALDVGDDEVNPRARPAHIASASRFPAESLHSDTQP